MVRSAAANTRNFVRRRNRCKFKSSCPDIAASLAQPVSNFIRARFVDQFATIKSRDFDFECDNVSLMIRNLTTRVIVKVMLVLLIGQLLFAAAQVSQGQGARKTPLYSFKIINTFPHDSEAFTQGLEYRGGFLYESTGLKGRSSLRKVRLETGEVLQRIDLPADYFGEGITLFKNEIVQLTWQSHVGFVYNLSDFRQVRQFSYPGEGWGLANDGREIFMSDGTPEIRVLDPATLAEKRRFTVHDGTMQIRDLNELEYVEGELCANIWQTNRIARISPQTGEVLGWVDLTGLLSPVYRLAEGAVLNGIAYDAQHKRLFVTGKLWPYLFEIRLVPKK
jgi:glutaminyl-peptide cyclotransferase